MLSLSRFIPPFLPQLYRDSISPSLPRLYHDCVSLSVAADSINSIIRITHESLTPDGDDDS